MKDYFNVTLISNVTKYMVILISIWKIKFIIDEIALSQILCRLIQSFSFGARSLFGKKEITTFQPLRLNDF